MYRHGTEAVSLVQKQIAQLCLTDARGILEHCVEDRFQFAGRAGNDLQHLRRRRLLLQRFGQFAGALLLGLKQSYILDCNHRLVGKSIDQVNLSFSEWLDPGAATETARQSGFLREAGEHQGWLR